MTLKYLLKVEKGVVSFFTDEYKRFETVLKNTIDKNENKRVEFYYRLLKDFIRHAERGTLARLKLLDRSEEEQQRVISQSNDRIRELELKCKQSRIELESYKSEIITKLAEKLQAYLYSSRGREDILNPPHKQIICEVSYRSLDKEVPARVQSGIQRWCEGQEVKAIIDDADAKMKSTVEEIESQLQEIEIEMTGIYTRVEDSTGAVILGLGLGLGFLFLPFSIVFTFVFALVIAPLYIVWGWFVSPAGVRQKVDEIYNECLSKVSMSELKASFAKSFGVEYNKVIVRIFDESIPKLIASLRTTNKKLLDEHKSIKQKRDSFMRLKENIQKIQEATKNFEIHC
ncbi:uncharacterized protein [Mytilus edulis]|uniref:uncharacterized protein n=1 Tax=Mytilus edulis TaxID=6550 RepID=UPI0039EFA457